MIIEHARPIYSPTGSTGLTLPLLLKVVCLALGCMHALDPPEG